MQALAHRLYAAGVPALHLQILGQWLFRDVTSSLHLAGALTTRGFQELATRTFRAGRYELLDAQLVVWRYSGILPRWRAVPTWHTGAWTPHAQTSPASLNWFSAAMRMPMSGRPVGVRPRSVQQNSRPLRGVSGATPCKYSSAWRPIGGPDGRRGDPAGRDSSSLLMATSAFFGWARPQRGYSRTRT